MLHEDYNTLLSQDEEVEAKQEHHQNFGDSACFRLPLQMVNIYRNNRETSKLAYIIDHCTVNMIFEGFPAVVTLPFVNSTNYSTWESTIEQVIVVFSFVLEWIMHLLQFVIKLVNEVCSEMTFCLG